MLTVQDIHSLTDFLRNHKAHIHRMKQTGKPELLTVNGKAELVIIDAEVFQTLLDKVDRAETIEAIREGLAAAERGEMKTAEQVFEEMRGKYGLPG